MGISFSTHFCMGLAVDSKLMIGMQELNCGMMDMDAECTPLEEGYNYMSPKCCDTEYISLEIGDNYEKVTEKISLDNQFLYAFTYTFLLSNHSTQELTFALIDFQSPPLEQDFQSLYQTFLL